MTQPHDASSDGIIDTLQERAKELNCLYRVHELTTRADASLDDVGRGLIEAIPQGWQHAAACWARVTLDGTTYQPPRVTETPWLQRADITVDGARSGSIEVFYTKPFPPGDEGPFLAEERKLIDTIAGRLGLYLSQRRLLGALRTWQASHQLAADVRPEWWVVVEFLRDTDHHLLMRLSRRLINYLCWNGVEEAQTLLQRFALTQRAGEGSATGDDNRPTQKTSLEAVLATADEAFRVAARHLGPAEILSCMQRWMKDDKSGFLIEAVENQGTSLTDITDALERHQQLALGDKDLSRAMQLAMRASLVRRFFTEDLDFINIAKNYVEVDDFHALVQHVISPPGSHGKLGGKSSGLFLATQIVRRSPEYADAVGEVRVPRTWYLTSDTLLDFIEFNHLEDVYDRKYLELDQIRREYPHIVQVFKHSTFRPEIVKGLSLALDDFEDRPLIVRSSSLLEDRMGAAFSGKYKSLFLSNQGPKRERLAALMDAIAEVYASVFGPDPLEYRAERGLLDLHEEMAIMIQEVVGTRTGRYFLPAFAGVAFSNNEFRWSARIRREDGLLRIVPGLGTRAVDRVGDDYPILIAPAQPGLRVNVTPDEVARYSPRHLDVINLDTRQFETITVADLVRECGRDLPAFAEVYSVLEDGRIQRPAFGLDLRTATVVATCEGLVTSTPFVARMRTLLRILREKLGYPVDLEFASDGSDFYLLQCRPQCFGQDDAPAAIPADVPAERLLFAADRYVSNGHVPDLTHVVCVFPDQYAALPDLGSLKDVGRAVGRLNKLLPKRRFALVGPGRWGSRGDVRMGVGVTYSDINNTALLMEVAARRGNYVPEVSFGTHFFQDLVESDIRYLPLFPDERGQRFNAAMLRQMPNLLADLAPEFAHLSGAMTVVDLPASTGGLVLRVLMNGEIDRAVGYLVPPGNAPQPAAGRRRESSGGTDDHWRWRLRIAEQIGAALDPRRFGVRALYLVGSTRTATAGPHSDVDLLVHFTGTDEQRRALLHWFEGWSLCLAELNHLRTGSRPEKFVDVHLVTDEDLERPSGIAATVGALTDAARPIPLAVARPPRTGE